MGNLFSKKPKVTDTDRAILVLKTQRRKLSGYQKQLDAVILREIEVARELLRQRNKDRALLTLKKKKAQEELLKKVDVWIMNVEQQIIDIETAGRQKAVFQSLKEGQRAIEDLQKEINIEDIQKLLDDSAEAKAYQDDINAVLGQQLTDEDEEAVLAELETLELKMGIEDLPKVPQQVPDAPAKVTSEETKQPRKEQTLEAPIAEPADGLNALLEGSNRSAAIRQDQLGPVDDGHEVMQDFTKQDSTAKEDIEEEEEEEEEELDLPSVPTSSVRADSSKLRPRAPLNKERELLPA